jgi:hypothetical protein
VLFVEYSLFDLSLDSKNTGHDTGYADGTDGDGVQNWKQKKGNESKSKSMTNKNGGDLKTSVYTPSEYFCERID